MGSHSGYSTGVRAGLQVPAALDGSPLYVMVARMTEARFNWAKSRVERVCAGHVLRVCLQSLAPAGEILFEYTMHHNSIIRLHGGAIRRALCCNFAPTRQRKKARPGLAVAGSCRVDTTITSWLDRHPEII